MHAQIGMTTISWLLLLHMGGQKHLDQPRNAKLVMEICIQCLEGYCS